MSEVPYGDLVKRALAVLGIRTPAELSAFAREKLHKSSRAVEKWRAGTNKPPPASLERMRQLVGERDRRLAEEIQEAVASYTWHSKPDSDERDAMLEVIARFRVQIDALAEQRNELDKSVILRDALSLGLDALSRGAAAQRQVKINKEAHRRAHPKSA